VKTFAKSLFVAFMGTGVFFSFLMMITVPLMALFKRTAGNIQQTSEVVNPALFLRTYGVPAALVLFIVLFAYGIYHFRHQQHRSLPAVHH
jgi:hypothetical protein